MYPFHTVSEFSQPKPDPLFLQVSDLHLRFLPLIPSPQHRTNSTFASVELKDLHEHNNVLALPSQRGLVKLNFPLICRAVF